MHQDNNHKPHIDGDKKDIKSVALFAGDTHAAYLFKKTEQLASALYLITGLLSDNEPMKWQMRDLGLRLLSHGVSFSRMSLKERRERGYDVVATLLESLSLLEIAHTAGLLSRMNYQLVKGEVEKVVRAVEGQDPMLAPSPVALPSDFFNEADFGFEHVSSLSRPLAGGNGYKGHKDIKDVVSDMKGGHVLEKAHGHLKDKNQRQDKIISLLQGGKILTIKDFSKEIKECSEKTIQRELLALVASGTIKKDGERRWSRYSLKV